MIVLKHACESTCQFTCMFNSASMDTLVFRNSYLARVQFFHVCVPFVTVCTCTCACDSMFTNALESNLINSPVF